tara:strand:+ start:1462 stop:1797 length:336 start_codon:yes stop_codon:yes gene_type:complete
MACAITVKYKGFDRYKVQRADYKGGRDTDRWKPITIQRDSFHYLQRDRERKGLEPLPFTDSKEYALYLYLTQVSEGMIDKSWFGQWVRAFLSEDVTVFTLIDETRIVTIGE